MSETTRHFPGIENSSRLDAEVDKLGNVALARIRLGIEEPPTTAESETSRRVAGPMRVRTKKPSARHTGGRALNEGADKEHDPYWGQTSGGIKSIEQQEINARGREYCRAAQ